MKSTNVDISIIVPSRGRGDRLRRLLDLLSVQETPAGTVFDVLVGLDGEPDEAIETLPNAFDFDLQYFPLPRVGISTAKNAACAEARGRIMLLLNDDVEPEPGFVRAHADAHAAGHSIVLGSTPWGRFEDQTVFDEAIARTGMIFFYDGLATGGRYNFRHAWNLNLSVDRKLLDRLDGPFAAGLRPYMYEDIESAYRMIGDRSGVCYHSAARATHNHRYTFDGYFQREAMLGVMAPHLFSVNPACFRAVFRSDLERLVEQARRALPTDMPDGRRTLEQLREVAQRRWSDGAADLGTFYVAHLPLKRRAFRVGLVAAVTHPDAPWQTRVELANDALADDEVFQVREQAVPSTRTLAPQTA